MSHQTAGGPDPPSAKETELHAALSEGDPHRVRSLIQAGANIHYKREHGYDARW
jgi:hypothetical protein